MLGAVTVYMMSFLTCFMSALLIDLLNQLVAAVLHGRTDCICVCALSLHPCLVREVVAFLLSAVAVLPQWLACFVVVYGCLVGTSEPNGSCSWILPAAPCSDWLTCNRLNPN
jgi:hypothetical protein